MPEDGRGNKWACEPCIRGHRSSRCEHWDRFMIVVRKPGRPLSTCPHPKDECQCTSDRVMMVKMLKHGRCLCKPVSMLGPDGRAMPLPDDDDSGSCSSEFDTVVPSTVIPSGTTAGARASGIQEAPNKARHRVQKSKKRSGSVVDPRAVARAFDSSLSPAMGLQSREPVENNVNRYANGSIEAAKPGFISHSPNFAQPPMPSLRLPTAPLPPRPGYRPEYDPVHQSTAGFGDKHNGQVSAYLYFNHQAGSSAYPEVAPLLSSHATLPNSNRYLDHGWVSQAQGLTNVFPGEPRNSQMVESNAMKAQCNHHNPKGADHMCPAPSQHGHGIIPDHVPDHFQFQNSSTDTSHSYICPTPYPATTHSMVRRDSTGLVGLSEGFMERFPASSQEETTYTNIGPGAQSHIPGLSHNCDCGKGCRCFACPEHPDNATTRARTAALSQIMVADGLLDPVNFQDISFDTHNSDPNGPLTNGGIPSPRSTLRPDMMSSQSEKDTHQTLSPWHEQSQPLDVDLSSDYWTYEIPVEPSGCTCGDNCSCPNCLIHGDQLNGQPPSESQNLASQHGDLSNGHA